MLAPEQRTRHSLVLSRAASDSGTLVFPVLYGTGNGLHDRLCRLRVCRSRCRPRRRSQRRATNELAGPNADAGVSLRESDCHPNTRGFGESSTLSHRARRLRGSYRPRGTETQLARATVHKSVISVRAETGEWFETKWLFCRNGHPKRWFQRDSRRTKSDVSRWYVGLVPKFGNESRVEWWVVAGVNRRLLKLPRLILRRNL